MTEAIGGLFSLILLVTVIGLGILLLTGNAVLYSEMPDTKSGYGFNCRYFTGTRTVELWSGSPTGCIRIIPVGK